ncbi:XRE family transcriptional regulator [Clostridium fermenticellae]|uniref:XRE family transcriptional regulator n=1 Tax=Clostridium fermenticellae TaxID=2068654 RepID=A0A386H6P2_9CLOT|nr:helix-turn-helix transcriptional regulator [Clostridium fermenticellae]AYD41185.1 XRE family transcriptional regulator [Clostridium fermenticellae]
MKNTINAIDAELIGTRIRKERETLGLTREKFAEVLDLSPLYIGQLERGERLMSLSTLIKISNILNISTDYLIHGKSTHESLMKEHSNEPLYNKNNSTLYALLNKCSQKELTLIESMVKLIIPYIR